MTRNTLRQIMLDARITAIVRLDDLSAFQPLAEALLEGGIRCLEFTLTNREALTAVSHLRKNISSFDSGEAVIGIGSVRSREDAQAAIDAGAQLLVSPTVVMPMIELANQNDILCAPGAYTPTEIETAWQAGADVVKVFPATALGPSYMKTVLAPMPDIRLMPTGGINLDNMASYLKVGCAALGIGSNLVHPAMINAGDWDGLRELAAQYVAAAQV
ncbi:MAG: bifunctional 4-hydroxy-2-oxoglutarate aldolase/2-dehydro-3-deoxy-phosphogluconate aldolase [Anaerolineaceae bacterium]|nr:bifunctional 4-hydroxy-2-oxoglutarate aldolase/2-dehydro-3-deoxy-phosphogluconate aldolase [Anaerolineaceae bacterium]